MNKKNDVEKIRRLLNILAQWSGVSDDSPPDTEIVSNDSGDTVYYEDLQEAMTILNTLQ